MTSPALYGIRHHGPGSARSLRDALVELSPDVVLIEGPPEADGLVELAGDPEMQPPVALLGYVPGEPKTAAFWPFAVFSPEWQAIRYALGAGIPVRFCDLPAAHQLAMVGCGYEKPRTDPVSELAAAAGYDDPERWWEDVVEHVPGPAVFAALAEAIGFLRAEDAEPDPRDAVREAYMRKVLRRTVKEGYQRIAVVCGAWHVPALSAWAAAAAGDRLPAAAADDRLLRGLPKMRATLTWVPWTYSRLAYASGYGAGIRSPGWYDHLFSSAGQPLERWLAKAAAVLRDEGVPASSAHVIESVRLAEALAALRGRPLAGLEEVTESARAVLCEGSDRLGLTRLLLEPEMLDAVEPDVHLVGTLLSLSRVLPDQARESARAVVRTVTSDLERRLAQRTRSAVTGALNRASRTSRPRRPADIDWDRTIRANLRNYLPRHRTVVPERLVGYARKQQAVARDVIVCLDQSGSMASSAGYSARCWRRSGPCARRWSPSIRRSST